MYVGPARTTSTSNSAPLTSTTSTSTTTTATTAAETEAPKPPSSSAPPTAERVIVSADTQAQSRARVAADPRAAALQQRLQAQTAMKGHDGALRGDSAAHVGALPPPRTAASTFASVDAARAAVERDYGVVVKDAVAPPWTTEDLSRIHESLAKMGPAERSALRGVELHREHAVGGEAPQEKNKTAGFYDPTGGQRGPSITFYDAAFPSTKDSADDRRGTMHTVLHEAGHAVEGNAGNAAIADYNEKNARLTAANDDEKPAAAALTQAQDQWVQTANKSGARGPTARAMSDFNDALNASSKAATAMARAKTPKDLDAAAADFAKATGQRDAAFARLPEGKVKAAAVDVKDAHDAWVAKRNDWAAAKRDVFAADARLNQLYAVRDDPKTPASEAKTKKLEQFEKAGGNVAVSGYGRDGVGENFAEAYALYRRDPAYLESKNKRVYDELKRQFP